MAEYRDLWNEIRGAGADVAAVAVDPPERAAAVHRQLELNFPILCDTKREVVRAWNVFEPKQMGGIAKPAVFVVDRERRIRFASIDREAVRVPASAVLDFVAHGMPADGAGAKRRFSLPGIGDFLRATRNVLRFGMRAPKN
ncbi:MAG TPA: redoxin domain-containing protein [Candidatus Acidoferrales bacterium]|nr:redoxin domain-containing protein [Candidatus Acidoferrales bacterium]